MNNIDGFSDAVDKLPKYLYLVKSKKEVIYYQLVFVKLDWDEYVAMYSRDTKIGYSKKCVLLQEKGRTLHEAVDKLKSKVDGLFLDGVIAGKRYIPENVKKPDPLKSITDPYDLLSD